jgi:hypothetical protein
MTSEDKKFWIKTIMQSVVWAIGIAAFIFTLSNEISVLSTKFDNIVDTVNNISKIVEKIRTETIPKTMEKHEGRVHEGAATEKYVDKKITEVKNDHYRDIQELKEVIK